MNWVHLYFELDFILVASCFVAGVVSGGIGDFRRNRGPALTLMTLQGLFFLQFMFCFGAVVLFACSPPVLEKQVPWQDPGSWMALAAGASLVGPFVAYYFAKAGGRAFPKASGKC